MARNVADLPTALPELAIDQQGFDAPSPQLVMLNDELATQLGLSPQWLRSDAGLKFLTGHGASSETDTPPGLYETPVATAYAGHQFGNFAGLLGDGRALLLATVEAEPGLTGLPSQPSQPSHSNQPSDPNHGNRPNQPSAPNHGNRPDQPSDANQTSGPDYPNQPPHSDSTQAYEIQAKGTGPTPFSRGGDGKATLTSALREYLISEAMYALGVPTTRALAVIATGEEIYRGSQTPFDNTDPTTELQPGGIIVRVASSHLRVGTFELVARSGADTGIMDRLIEFAAQRHGYEVSAELVLRDVVKRQANLVAAWMACGFVHGVLNTDNASIAGETIDYGPCAFLDAHNPRAVFSSIDRGGRYAYGAQPTIAGWNMARLAEALLPHFAGTPDDALARARDILGEFANEFTDALSRKWLPKIGLPASLADNPAAAEVLQQWQGVLVQFGLDHTNAHRALIEVLARDDGEEAAESNALTSLTALTRLSADPAFSAAVAEWGQLWKQTREELGINRATALALMRETNPLYIPRNHLVTEVLATAGATGEAGAGDLAAYRHLLEAVTNPFGPQDVPADFTEPAPQELGAFHSYCGT
ncbi:protein adenylyltransferase SelO family protein [uncultured Corynebacterium sp.]|uniref:protein adenylyltransferase SelO family protein n=1 Tax=uncultured Corynebacterium sp. TaxID=159447 RepID=UPI0026123869|nr:protein adenylyltransferase SelO family protein [uncultured Corynebacterium sp.]